MNTPEKAFKEFEKRKFFFRIKVFFTETEDTIKNKESRLVLRISLYLNFKQKHINIPILKLNKNCMNINKIFKIKDFLNNVFLTNLTVRSPHYYDGFMIKHKRRKSRTPVRGCYNKNK